MCRSSRLSRVVLVVWVTCLTPWILEGGANQKTDPSVSVKPHKYINRCYKDDPSFIVVFIVVHCLHDCVVKTMNDIRDRMVIGIPEMGVPPIEPLFLGDVDPPFEVAGQRLTVKNILGTGASNITVVSASGSLETGKFAFVGKMDRALVSGDYQLSSALPFLPYALDGKMTGTISDITYLVDFQTEVVTRNEVDFLHIVSLELRLIMGDMVGNLWIGGQRLDVLNRLLNLPFNVLVIKKALTSTLEPAFGSVVFKYANLLLGAFPYDTLIPDSRPSAIK